MSFYSLHTPEEISETLAGRLRELRLAIGWKQATLAQRSGVTLASLRRFEVSGQISLKNLLKLVFVLGRLDEFDKLLHQPEASSMAELEAMDSQPRRQRGRI